MQNSGRRLTLGPDLAHHFNITHSVIIVPLMEVPFSFLSVPAIFI
jgi:hypothetical protein